MKLKDLIIELDEGVIDPIQNTLSPEFFDSEGNLLQIPKTVIKQTIDKIINMIDNSVFKDKISISFEDALFVGARATYQYTLTSDADVNIGITIIDKSVDETTAIKFINNWIISNLDKKIKVGDIQIQFRISSTNEKDGHSSLKYFDGVYDISGAKWIKSPNKETSIDAHSKHIVNNEELKNKYKIFKDSLNNELSVLNGLNVSKINKDIVLSICTKIVNIFQTVYDARAHAFKRDEKFLADHGRISLNWSDENIFYKWMEDDFGELINTNYQLYLMLINNETDATKLVSKINLLKSIRM